MKPSLALMAALFLSIVLSHTATAQKALVIASVEYAPFTSAEMENHGYVNQIIKQAFARKGIVTTFEYIPWARALRLGEEGYFEAISYAQYVEDRTAHFWFSNPIINEEFFIFTHKDTTLTAFSGMQSLSDLRLGLTRGYAYNDEVMTFANAHPDTVVMVNSDLQNFRMLSLKRIDAFPINRMVGQRIINKHFPGKQNQFRMLEPSVYSTPTYLIISKRSPRGEALLKAFNEGLQAMEVDGTLSELQQAMRRSKPLPN